MRISDWDVRSNQFGLERAIRSLTEKVLLFFLLLDGNAPSVEATLRTDDVRRSRFTTIGAGTHCGHRKVVVRSALPRARL